MRTRKINIRSGPEEILLFEMLYNFLAPGDGLSSLQFYVFCNLT